MKGAKTSARGYGWAHQKLRAKWSKFVAAGEVNCARCGRPIKPDQVWDLGHDDRDRTVYTGPEHAHKRDCPAGGNRATKRHRKRTSRALPSYEDDPERGIFWGPPSIDRPYKPIRWSRPWFDWRASYAAVAALRGMATMGDADGGRPGRLTD
jgi:hypothetical protein